MLQEGHGSRPVPLSHVRTSESEQEAMRQRMVEMLLCMVDWAPDASHGTLDLT